ncbi:hypothetical protein PIB30_105149 [Stylosanthes scabra]|uniref:Uncharacterized protein n=1 Tax=Stylosanthes scabra TaxID=79078 RepID=A0ABU6Y0X5_9FABA|nr:hypothetical protein [Stylosanthes scabra]
MRKFRKLNLKKRTCWMIGNRPLIPNKMTSRGSETRGRGCGRSRSMVSATDTSDLTPAPSTLGTTTHGTSSVDPRTNSVPPLLEAPPSVEHNGPKSSHESLAGSASNEEVSIEKKEISSDA